MNRVGERWKDAHPRRKEKMMCEHAQRQGIAKRAQGPGGPQCKRPRQEKRQIALEHTELNRGAGCCGQFTPAGRGGYRSGVGEKILSQRHPLVSSGVWRSGTLQPGWLLRGKKPHIWMQLFWSVFHSPPPICADGRVSSVTGGAQILRVSDLPKSSRKLAPFLWR